MDEPLLKSGQFPNVAIMAGSDPKEVMREHRQVIPDGEKYELDTREKLNEELMDSCLTFANGGGHLRAFAYVSDLLDRQAALTKNECREEHRKLLGELHDLLDEAAREREELAWRVEYNGELVEKVKRERNELQTKVDSLTAERDALKEQINRFNASKSEEIAENDTSKGVINNFDVQNDTREQLEADIAALYAIGAPSENAVLGWLDRQAAITERECMKQATTRYIGWDCAECAEGLGKELDARCDPLKKRIVELTAERDQLKADLKTANDTINILRASVAGLKETVEKLGAQ